MKFDGVINNYLDSNEIVLTEGRASPIFNPKLVYTTTDRVKFFTAISAAISGMTAKPKGRENLTNLEKIEAKTGALNFNQVAKLRVAADRAGDPVKIAGEIYRYVTSPTTSGGLGLLPLMAEQMPRTATTPGVARTPGSGPVPMGGSKTDKNSKVNSAGAIIQQAHKDILNTIDKSQPTITAR